MFKMILMLLVGFIILVALVTGYRVIRIKLSVVSYRNFWIKQAAVAPKPDDFIYVALGDSTAQAIGASKPLKGYVGLVAEHVKTKTGKNVHIVNLSVSGARLRDVIDKQLPGLKLIPKIDLITIEAGANDVVRFNEATFTAEFSELVAGLPAGTVVSDIGSFQGGRMGKLRDTSQIAANIATDAIASRADLNIAHLFIATDTQGFSDFAADVFHPNDKGYQNWAQAFIDALPDNLK